MPSPDKDNLDKFTKEMLEDLGGDPESAENHRYLAGAKDTESGISILMLMVPVSALTDGVGPDLWRTPDKHKFLAAMSEEECFTKAADIEDNFPLANDERKNEMMAEYLASFMPALFERASTMKPLNF